MGNDGCGALDGVKIQLFKTMLYEHGEEGFVRSKCLCTPIPAGVRYLSPQEALVASQRMQHTELN